MKLHHGAALLLCVSVRGLLPPPCGPGHGVWPGDGQCHQLNTRGPCGRDQVLLSTGSGPSCVSFVDPDKDKPSPSSGLEPDSELGRSLPAQGSSPSRGQEPDRELGWSLPVQGQKLSHKERKCLSREMVFWPADGECYSLLTRGPCARDTWLVARGGRVTCQPRACPCDPALPGLCEVELRNVTACGDTRHGSCVVALAAEQDGHCGQGEQLLVSPGGWGECGCVRHPPHLRLPGHTSCHQVYTRGPCPQGSVLQVDPASLAPVCGPGVCGEAEVEYEGRCCEVGERGPCPRGEVVILDPEAALRPSCAADPARTQRLYDLLPRRRGIVRFGPVTSSFRLPVCDAGADGQCRPRRRRPGSRFRRKMSPEMFLNWINKYR